MRTTNYKTAVETQCPFLKFVSRAEKHSTLDENEYYAIMVTDDDFPNNGNPYVIGIEQTTHEALVGIEGTGDSTPYISKHFANRYSPYRGTTIIVEVPVENISKCCLLKYK